MPVNIFFKEKPMTIKVHEKLLMTGAAGGLGEAMRERLKVQFQGGGFVRAYAFGG